MDTTDDLARLGALLTRPDEEYLGRIESIRETLAGRHGEAARQLGVFGTRLAGLTADELQELFDASFEDRAMTTVHALAAQLTEPDPQRPRILDMLRTIDGLLPALEARRNPFVYLLKSICCLLLASPGSDERSSFIMERTSS